MDGPRPAKGTLKKMLLRLKNLFLIGFFLLVPFAGAFHPKLCRREDPDEKEIGAEK